KHKSRVRPNRLTGPSGLAPSLQGRARHGHPRTTRHMKGLGAMNHYRPSPRGRLVLLTVPLLLAVAAPVRAQHQVTTSRMYPITGGHTYSPPAACTCESGPSALVTLSGVVHGLTRVPPGLTRLDETHASPTHGPGLR